MSTVGIIKTACNPRLLANANVYFRFTLTSVEPSAGTCVNFLQKRRQHAAAKRKDVVEVDDVKKCTQIDIDDNIQKFKAGNFETVPDPEHLAHFKQPKEPKRTTDVDTQGSDAPPIGIHTLPHPIWSDKELYSVQITHKPPQGFVDKAAYHTIQVVRKSFDFISGFSWGQRTEKKWLKRIIFLETVAAVPGMVAAMTRHLHSLRRMRRDYGWIHTLLEEAENERMHLMTVLQLKKPTHLFRLGVIGAQGAFVTMFSVSYLISPKFCHRLVGYLEEEAVKTYTKCLQDIETGSVQEWKTTPAPDLAIRYWRLPPNASMKDVILVIRADEAHHRVVNHTLASLKDTDYNPYKPGE